jgi:hypothetical protein
MEEAKPYLGSGCPLELPGDLGKKGCASRSALDLPNKGVNSTQACHYSCDQTKQRAAPPPISIGTKKTLRLPGAEPLEDSHRGRRRQASQGKRALERSNVR